jgi:3-methyladenine DNA glycosylase AlkD
MKRASSTLSIKAGGLKRASKGAEGATVLDVGALRQRLIECGDESRAVSQRKYLKMDQMPVPPLSLGCTVPSVTAAVKNWCAVEGTLPADAIVSASIQLWEVDSDAPTYELRLACVKLLRAKAAVLPVSFLPVLEGFLESAHTWALIDELSMRVAPPLLAKLAEPGSVIKRWSTHENVWVRRTSLLAHTTSILSGKGPLDWQSFVSFAGPMLVEKSFWIRKAIGWVLRDVSRKQPELVATFLSENIESISGVTWREATKYLPKHSVTTLSKERGRHQ